MAKCVFSWPAHFKIDHEMANLPALSSTQYANSSAKPPIYVPAISSKVIMQCPMS